MIYDILKSIRLNELKEGKDIPPKDDRSGDLTNGLAAGTADHDVIVILMQHNNHHSLGNAQKLEQKEQKLIMMRNARCKNKTGASLMYTPPNQQARSKQWSSE